MFFPFPNVTACVRDWVPCPECQTGMAVLKRACEEVACTESESRFYTMIVLPLLLHVAFVYWVAYKLDKKEELPFWRSYLLVSFALGVYFVTSFGVFMDRDQTFDPTVRCTNNFPLMFSIIGIMYVIAFSFLLPLVVKDKQPHNESKYFGVVIVGLFIFLAASRVFIFA